ncbi:MAG: transglutaminase domain-containing protein [Bacteroidia bacterium]
MKQIVLGLMFLLGTAQSLWALDQVNSDLYEHAQSYQPDTIVLAELVPYLIGATANERQKAEILYYWIAQNINYDVESAISGSYLTSTQDILLSKAGVCEDYAKLYQQMAAFAGLECYFVQGYAKGFGPADAIGLQSVNHSWNIVKVDGQYLFLDATWGSGRVAKIEGVYQYQAKLSLQYILDSPHKMLKTHLPADPIWQMTEWPIDMKAFREAANTYYLNSSAERPYPFTDKLCFYKRLNQDGQAIVSYTRAYHFHPTEQNLEELILSYQHAGYALLNGEFDEKRIYRGVLFYKRSAQLIQYHQGQTSRSSQLLADAEQALSYGNYRLNKRL